MPAKCSLRKYFYFLDWTNQNFVKNIELEIKKREQELDIIESKAQGINVK